MDAELPGDLAGERVVGGAEFRPAVGDRAEVGGPVGARGDRPAVGGVLACDAEDVAHQRRRGGEPRGLRHPQCLDLAPDAFEDPQQE